MGRRESDRHIASTARTSPPSYDRRIGNRVLIESVAVEWLPLLPRKRFGRSRVPQRGAIVELSITGAQMRAPADSAIIVGTQVFISVDGLEGIVEVRRIHAALDPEHSFYGVQFIRLDPALGDLFDRTLALQRSDEAGWRWDNAD